jgi:hypothetical protein
VLAQTYGGPIELSVFDDASDDGTDEAVRAWALRARAAGLAVAVSGSRWGGAPAAPGGIGFAKNAAVAQSSGSVLVFLDADDIMLPGRCAAQAAALAKYPRALCGCAWRRLPSGSTAHSERWSNGLSEAQLALQAFRETTLAMPTWAMARATFDAVGGFQTQPAEDFLFLHRFLDLRGRDARPLLRVGSAEQPLVLYRWSQGSMTSSVGRDVLLRAKAAAFERRVLSLPGWARYTVWGAGRDGKQFVAELSPAARARIACLADVDPRKVGARYVNHRLTPPLSLPIVHVRDITGPAAVCVSMRRADEPAGELRAAAAALGLVEGETVWFLF